MNAQHTQNLPLALDLANWLESVSTGLSANQAAAELRRLHAASERLAALEAALARQEVATRTALGELSALHQKFESLANIHHMDNKKSNGFRICSEQVASAKAAIKAPKEALK